MVLKAQSEFCESNSSSDSGYRRLQGNEAQMMASRGEMKEVAPSWSVVFNFWRLYSNVLNKLNSGTSGFNDSVTEE